MGGKKANEENKKRTTTTQMATMTLTMSMNGQKKRHKKSSTYAKNKQPKKEKPRGWDGWFSSETRAGEPENAVQPAIIISSRCNSLPYTHTDTHTLAYICV